jgi:hypothetical protein
MCDFGTNYPTEQSREQLRAIFVETILPALRNDKRCAALADAIVGIEIVQDAVIFKLKHGVTVNNEVVGRHVKGLNLSFSIVPGAVENGGGYPSSTN